MKLEEAEPVKQKRAYKRRNTNETSAAPASNSKQKKQKKVDTSQTTLDHLLPTTSKPDTSSKRGRKKSDPPKPPAKRGRKPKNVQTTPTTPKRKKSKEAEDCSYDDLFSDDNHDVDEDVDTIEEESEYEPSNDEDAEVEQIESPVVATKSRARRSTSSGKANENRDIYDFDAQSVLSDKRSRAAVKTSAAKRKQKSMPRVVRKPTAVTTNWSSNIYSALSVALKTRPDLEAYTNFLKSTYLNVPQDTVISNLCNPSIQHADLFYGASACLQNLLSRVNDHDKIIQILHCFVSGQFDVKQHRVNCLIPVIHQPIFGAAYSSTFSTSFASLAMSIDPEMIIRPGYVLSEHTNLLAMRIHDANECGVTSYQYNTVTGTGSLGHYIPEIRHLVVSSDVYQKFSDMVSPSSERLSEMADSALNGDQTIDENGDYADEINTQRIVCILNECNELLALTTLDTWERTAVPQNRATNPLEVISTKPVTTDCPVRETTVEGVDEAVVDQVTSEQIDVDPTCDDPLLSFDDLRFVDAFLIKPHGRSDSLLLAMNKNCCNPTDKSFTEDFRIFSILDESKFMLEKHGFAPDMPIALDGVHLADPEELLEEKALLVVPDLLYDTLKRVMLRELVSSSGALSVVTAMVSDKQADSKSTSARSSVNCAKFVLLDRNTRVPISVVFDSPVRFTLQVSDGSLTLNPFGEAASREFDAISSSELKANEANFKPTTAQYRLVAINGLMFGVQIDELRVVHRVIEVVPARFSGVFPHRENLINSAQAITGSHQSCSASVQIINEETSSSTVLPALYYPHPDRQKSSELLYGFVDNIYDRLLDLPIKFSLFDIVFRMGQKHMPELLTKQHIVAAEAAALAEAATNPDAPPPLPVPIPDYWSVCSLCSKDLRSITGLLNHEMRHFGLSRYCRKPDRKSAEPQRPSVAPAAIEQESGSEREDEGDETGRRVKAGLTQVFNANLLVGRMSTPRCDKCGDHFLSADILVQHLEFCDGVSFSVRTPLSKSDDFNAANDSTLADTTADADKPIVCGLCGLHVESKESLIDHFNVKHLQCVVCSKKLRSIDELSQHYRQHKSDPATSNGDSTEQTSGDDPNALVKPAEASLSSVIFCETCSNFWGTEDNLYFHQWSEHALIQPPDSDEQAITRVRSSVPRQLGASMGKIRNINCKFCSQLVRIGGDVYVDHLATEHNFVTDQFSFCKICSDPFETPELLSVHLSTVHIPSGEYANAGLQTIFCCPHCEFYAFSTGLTKHSKVLHNDPSPAMFECMNCYERFSDRRTWLTHLEKHNEGYSHRCLECDRSFKLRSTLLTHIRTCHCDSRQPSVCEYCGISFPKRSTLRFHVNRTHSHELEHECNVCHRRFRTETELRRHSKELHSGAVRCEICHKVCTNLRSYSTHRQKHFRTRIYQCTDCDTTFKSKLAMKRHIRVQHLQLGPEKYECQICGKIVTQIGMHMLTHKDASFECEYCNKKFTKATYYNEHLRIHRGEQPFECHICQKRFNKKSNLNVHIKFHEKNRDDEGNYLELKARGRVSTMFGDALMSPDDRAARQIALKNKTVPKYDIACGSDLPGAFNVGGPEGAAAEAASRVIEPGVSYVNEASINNHFDIDDVLESPITMKLESVVNEVTGSSA